MLRTLTLVATLLAALCGAARAEIQQGVPEVFPSRHEISAHAGFQAGFGAKYGSASGFKLEADYAYKFHPIMWFDASVGNNFGFGNADGPCRGAVVFNPPSCYRGGWNLELAAGLKLKFPLQSLPIVIEVPVQLGVEVLYNRDCNDNGAAVPVLRTGGSGMYFLTKRIGVGLKIDFAAGPAFHGKPDTSCIVNGDSYTDFFGYFDFLFGAEFVL
jgi:hypothetical protein